MKNHLTLALALLTLICTSAHAQLPSYLPADGLVGWWPFNGNANDESGNGNDGSSSGAFANDRLNNNNSAVSLNGSNQKITLPGNDNLDTDIFSISFWTLPNAFSVHNQVQYGIIGSSLRFSLYWSTNGLAFSPMTCSGTYAPSGNSANSVGVSIGNWQHLTYVLEGQTTTFYVNGNLIGSQSTATPLSCFLSAMNLYFGADVGGGATEYYSGFFDDIAIYNRALTAQEIQNLYTATNTGNTADTGNGAAPLPQGIPYQAAARDANGQPVVDSPVNVRFTLHEGAADGATSYIESHSLTTNSIGLFNTVFGNGTPEQSAFDSINWAATTKFLQVEVDLGNGYADMGTTQLLSVPYAFRSAQAANIKNAALPIYPDNTAALAGGLVAGEMYRTATGDLKIVY